MDNLYTSSNDGIDTNTNTGLDSSECRCDICPFNPFRDEDDDDYEEDEG